MATKKRISKAVVPYRAAKMGRPEIGIDLKQLAVLCRLKPTLEDCANFFGCSPDTIENRIRGAYDVTFSEFRDQNMTHTRFSLVRKAIEKARAGDNVMLIFCLKNLCGWRDKQEIEHDVRPSFQAELAQHLDALGEDDRWED